MDSMEKGIFRRAARDFVPDQGFLSKEYFVYFETENRRAGAKDPLIRQKLPLEYCPP